MKRINKLLICFLSISICLISGCNTVKGVGKDVSKGGQEIERAAS